MATGAALRKSTRALSTLRHFNQTAGMHTRIHRLIEDKGCVLMPGCYDALSATLIERAGFGASFCSGYAVSASLLGKPDFGFLTPPEMASTARRVCDAAPKLSVIVDADTGGGNALNVTRTVKDLISAGAAGCFLEDQAWPKKCGHMAGKQVIVAEDHAAKIAAAREAIGDADFFLVARTDARSTSAKYGLQDAIARANLYIEAGADGCFVEAPRNDEELKEIGRRTNGYRVANMIEGGITPLHTPEELRDMGFHLMKHPLATVYAASRALVNVLNALKEKGSTREYLQHMATFKEFNNLIDADTWFDLEARYSSYKSPQAQETAVGGER